MLLGVSGGANIRDAAKVCKLLLFGVDLWQYIQTGNLFLAGLRVLGRGTESRLIEVGGVNIIGVLQLIVVAMKMLEVMCLCEHLKMIHAVEGCRRRHERVGLLERGVKT